MYRHKYELALLQCPQVNGAQKSEKASFTAFEVIAEISKAVKLATTFLFHRYQRTLQRNSVSGKQFLQEDSVDHINSKELYWEIKNISAQCNVPSVKPGPILTDKNHSSQKQGLTEKLLVWLAFTLARALAAQVLIRQLPVGSCLLPNTLVCIDCRTNEVLDSGSLSLNLTEEEQPVAPPI